MSAAALMDWLGGHLPAEQEKARRHQDRASFHAHMRELSGVDEELWMLHLHDHLCARYLAALTAKFPQARIVIKPRPQIPPPVWDTRPISPSDAMAAVRAMCGGAHG